MGFLARFFGAEKKGARVVIDIGSNHKIRAVALVARDGRADAREKHVIALPARGSDQAAAPFLGNALRRIMTQYVRTLGETPRQALIGIGSHYAKNEVMAVRYQRPRPGEPVRSRELEDAVRSFLDDAGQRLRKNALLLAHASPFQISVDGYPVSGAGAGRGGRAVEIRLLATYIARPYWNELEALRSQWKGIAMKFIPNRVALANAVTGGLGASDAMIVKIGSRITEVATVREKNLSFSGEFAMGGDDFTSALAREFKMAPSDAERLKCQLEGALLPERIRTRAEIAMHKTAAAWLKRMAEVLRANSGAIVPAKIYILGGGARAAAVLNALRARRWFEDLTFLSEIEVSVLGAEEIGADVFSKGSHPLRGPEEAALAALCREAMR